MPELACEIATRIAATRPTGFTSTHVIISWAGKSATAGIRRAGICGCSNIDWAATRKFPTVPGAAPATTRRMNTSSSKDASCDFRNELEHHAYPTVAVWVEKHNRYAIWEAALADRVIKEPIPPTIGGVQRFKRRLKKIAWRLPLRPLARFLYAYVVRLGFLDGKPGLYFCGLLAFYDFLAMANRYEMKIAVGHTTEDADTGPKASPPKANPQLAGSRV